MGTSENWIWFSTSSQICWVSLHWPLSLSVPPPLTWNGEKLHRTQELEVSVLRCHSRVGFTLPPVPLEGGNAGPSPNMQQGSRINWSQAKTSFTNVLKRGAINILNPSSFPRLKALSGQKSHILISSRGYPQCILLLKQHQWSRNWKN